MNAKVYKGTAFYTQYKQQNVNIQLVEPSL